ncbi:MAG TPA: hypothetical protein VMV99_11815 [Rhodanobacter sp.]|nr:hypothetical protein [Rhodanobacter sp.]
MGQLFTTFFGHVPSGHYGEEWKLLIEHFRGPLDVWDKNVSGSQRQFFRRWGDDRYVSEELLAPAGSPFSVDMDGDRRLVVRCKQVEIARYGLPDLFEAGLTIRAGEEGLGWNYLSELVPAHSAMEAYERFRRALACPYSETLVGVLGDDPRVRAFGVAASPECLSDSLIKTRVPTLSEIHQATTELRAALVPFRDVLQKWEGSDALEYVQRMARVTEGGASRSRGLGRFDADSALKGLIELAEALGEPEKRRGRPVKGGKENALVYLISRLWQKCGLGEPKYSPQSRFIRACSVVLPWHGIHKADVAQFVRGEIKKERKPRSIMSRGYVLNG